MGFRSHLARLLCFGGPYLFVARADRDWVRISRSVLELFYPVAIV